MQPDPAFADLLTAAGVWALVGCAVWAVLICVAAVLETVTAGRLRATRWVGCPPVLRRALLAGLGAALVATPVQAQKTAQNPAQIRSPNGTTTRTTPEPALPAPARPLGSAPRPAVTVKPGDNLWRLTEARLPGSAGAPEIAHGVQLLHRANREVIGPDPDLILPGQRLVVPRPSHPDQHPREESR